MNTNIINIQTNTNTTLNSQESTMTTSVLTKEKFTAIQTAFRGVFHDKDQKPSYCETYGTKYAGTLCFEHFIIYALLRGKNLAKVTHNVKSTHFTSLLSALLYLIETGKYHHFYRNDDGEIGYLGRDIGPVFGLTEDELIQYLSPYKAIIKSFL
jgi:hypothetical protein